MFPSKGGFIGLMLEAKEGVDNILTVEAYKEMKEVYDIIFKTETELSDGNGTISFSSICLKVGPMCIVGDNPLSFVKDSQNQIALDNYKTD